MKNIFFLAVLFIAAVSSCKAPKELVYQDIQNFGMKQANGNKTVLSMDIRLYNPNNYTLQLKHADVAVFVNNSPIGKLNASGGSSLPAHDTSLVPVTLEVDLKTVLPNMLQFILNSEVTIKLEGKIKAGRHGVYINVPVNYEGKQDIMSSIKL